MKRRTVIAAMALSICLAPLPLSQSCAQIRSARSPAPMATYTDSGGDLSFECPVGWKVMSEPPFYNAPYTWSSERTPQVLVGFSPDGNHYEKTTLAGLTFAYVKAAKPSLESCSAMVTGSTPQKISTVLIHGVTFEQFEFEGAGMCHESLQHVYWTYRGGTCYVFEGDMNTICSGVVEGERDLTAAETRALRRHLEAIPQSIQFAAGK